MKTIKLTNKEATELWMVLDTMVQQTEEDEKFDRLMQNLMRQLR